ncbi:uncharacterized protein LOC8263066 [Ricinus communis]|uniref:WW domain-containing protein n=1 Tax=Ricinus communis TaxID=3988 RepID=B9RJJ6_RICCO|nr:uncharacterized protein LOC8263066 [Ricinus communis]EEF48498.1 conserved hypothetical protein [Ricinus communis]|eukprot:XP_002513915.1 uncharacterized protein LOC8263066 [Ricinus communis]
MVSLQAAATSPNRRETIISEVDNSSKKRKWDEPQTYGTFEKRSKPPNQNTKPIFEIELQLETPLPLEWQQCLDIQSGEIHFYNTRTKKRTSRDPRRSPEPPSPGHMSLDLELHLQPCESQRKNNANDHSLASSIQGFGDLFMDSSKEDKSSEGTIKRCPSWIVEGDQEEMVATVCTRCHMLVMLCKSSPACPNCKFMHPPDQSPPKLFKQRFSLLC